MQAGTPSGQEKGHGSEGAAIWVNSDKLWPSRGILTEGPPCWYPVQLPGEQPLENKPRRGQQFTSPLQHQVNADYWDGGVNSSSIAHFMCQQRDITVGPLSLQIKAVAASDSHI